MLQTLYIENIGIIEELELDFSKGLNVLTGETGAGKSIIISAFKLLLGERVVADEILRSNSSQGKVKAQLFIEMPSFIQRFSDLDLSDGELFIERTVNREGRTKCYVNGSLVSLSVLREMGRLLVDVHGTYDHQKMLNSDSHIQYLDKIGDYDEDLLQIRKQFAEYNKLKSRVDEAKKEDSLRLQRLDSLRFQCEELQFLKDIDGGYEELEKEHKILGQASHILEYCNKAIHLCRDKDTSLVGEVKSLREITDELSVYHDEFSEFEDELKGFSNTLLEICSTIEAFSSEVGIDPNRLEELDQIISKIRYLERKYQRSFDELVEFQKSVEGELNQIESQDIEHLEKELKVLEQLFSKSAKELTQKRERAFLKLKKGLESSLADLGMEKARIELKNETGLFHSKGEDYIEFLLSTNKGEKAKPLGKVASGGELCRIMLAFKSILAEYDEIPILIFDEIDANIGGVTAVSAAKKMIKISENRQIITITHQPQIASKANKHFAVKKREKLNKTYTKVTELSREDRVLEISRMLGGTDITGVVKEHARQMLESN